MRNTNKKSRSFKRKDLDFFDFVWTATQNLSCVCSCLFFLLIDLSRSNEYLPNKKNGFYGIQREKRPYAF